RQLANDHRPPIPEIPDHAPHVEHEAQVSRGEEGVPPKASTPETDKSVAVSDACGKPRSRLRLPSRQATLAGCHPRASPSSLALLEGRLRERRGSTVPD